MFQPRDRGAHLPDLRRFGACPVIQYLPVVLLSALALRVVYIVVREVRESRRPLSPQDGCCGCGAALCDVRVGSSEGYCWACIDTWPASAVPAAEFGISVFPGRERGAR